MEQHALSDEQSLKVLLEKYSKAKLIMHHLEKYESNYRTMTIYESCKEVTETIEQMYELLNDDYTKKIINIRYIQGNPRKVTVAHFANAMDASTVDRRIVGAIAEMIHNLKLLRTSDWLEQAVHSCQQL